ncbi:hypothetical protein [Streptomyces sp. NPDC127084]|uniref:hypothetical protein n=1 Tax=Streptomyces sp. NPDC127084 TaxID=3347133 RepID=UPI0036584155
MSSHHTAPARTPARLPSYYGPGHEGAHRWHGDLWRGEHRDGFGSEGNAPQTDEATTPQTAEGAYAA